ncbi:MAG: hypothetical protein ACP5UA_04440 [Candidatus Hydrogenedens sp.]
MTILLSIITLTTFTANAIVVEKDKPIDYAYAMYDNFDMIDANGDDLITLQEAQRLIEGLDLEIFLSFDIDGNQQLSMEELQSAIKQLSTCGSQLQRGCSCAVNRVETWITDFITILFSMTILFFMSSSRNIK